MSPRKLADCDATVAALFGLLRSGVRARAFMTKEARLPDTLAKADPDPAFGAKQPIFRRSSATATVTIFEGGHEIIQPAAIAWMEELYQSDRTRDQGESKTGK